MPRKLGTRQESCLESLRRFGQWNTSYLCGWSYGSQSETLRIMESLVRAGVATKKIDPKRKWVTIYRPV